jgi:hypothetical protein
MQRDSDLWERRVQSAVIGSAIATIPLLAASLHRLDQPWSALVNAGDALCWGCSQSSSW